MPHPAHDLRPGVPRMPPDHPLAAIVDQMYRVLDLPAPATLGVCRGCCMSPAIEDDFLNHVPRDLPAGYVADWYFAAYSADIGYPQMGWILPRVLELLALDAEAFFHGEEVALSRLPAAGFPDRWPPRVVDLVHRFGAAWFDHRVASGTRHPDLTLCTLSNGGLPVEGRLDALRRLDGAALAALLHRAWCEEWCGKIWQTPFWNDEAARLRVWAFYTSPELEERMVDAGLGGDDRAARVADLIRDTRDG